MIYLNEWDKGAAAWLRELQYAGHIPPGIVDERSITEVTKEDLAGFTQCHFFAGIGGWPLALQKAGVPATVPLWTGSPPCQPFSVAGKQLGKDDPRHLAPAFLELVAQCRPAILYGEQVAAAIGKHWLDALLIELEEQGYTCGAAVLPACSVGAPHKRDRLFFGAHQLADTTGARHLRRESTTPEKGRESQPEHTGELQARSGGCALSDIQKSTGMGSVADTNDTRPQGRERVPERADQQPAGAGSVEGGMAHSDGRESGNRKLQPSRQHGQQPQDGSALREGIRGQRSGNEIDSANPHHGFWSDADWLGCRDGKFRPVEARSQPVVDGLSDILGCSSDSSFRKAFEEVGFPLGTDIPARVARLRGYGNAIVPQVAAEFIKAFSGAIADQKEKAATKN